MSVLRGCGLGPSGKTKFSFREGVIQGQMEVKLGRRSRSMPKILKVGSGVTKGQMAYHCCIDLKLSGWSYLRMPNFLKVGSRSSKVTQGQMVYHCCMDMNICE